MPKVTKLRRHFAEKGTPLDPGRELETEVFLRIADARRLRGLTHQKAKMLAFISRQSMAERTDQ